MEEFIDEEPDGYDCQANATVMEFKPKEILWLKDEWCKLHKDGLVDELPF